MKTIIDVILPNLAIGGAEKVMLLLAEQFKSNNYEVRFIVRRLTESGFQEQVEKDYELINLNAKKVRYFPFALKSKYKTIQKPDIVIVSLWPLTFLTALILKFTNKSVKVICVEHGSLQYQTRNIGKIYQLFLKWSLKLMLRFSDKVVCVSNGLKNEIKELTNYKKEKLISIPNPIELETLEYKDQVSDALKIQLNGHVFLFVGKLKKVKNIPLLLKAFKIVSEKIEATLTVLGDGPESNGLKRLAESLGIKEQVHFVGFKTNCKPYYQTADTFVLSSDSEGFGNVIVEALAEGCTVVSTNCPYGPKEILDNGTYGYLSEVNNEEDLAVNMLKSVNNPFSKQLLKERALSYSPSFISQHYLDMFNSI
jgi:glycosyltransferase involved in cell wall biosynthesis